MSDEDDYITTDMIEVTRRIKSKNPVSNRDIWEREYRLIVFKFFPGNAEPPVSIWRCRRGPFRSLCPENDGGDAEAKRFGDCDFRHRAHA